MSEEVLIKNQVEEKLERMQKVIKAAKEKTWTP